MMTTGSRAHSRTDMLAVMVVRPMRPSAYATPGLSTPSAPSRRTDGDQVSGSRRTSDDDEEEGAAGGQLQRQQASGA